MKRILIALTVLAAAAGVFCSLKAATERLRKEREEVELVGSNDYGETILKRKVSLEDYRRENYQRAIDAAWERSMDYRAELARWRDGEV